MEERMKIVIVGHVDHGKSTLIGRLFYDTNSLPKSKFEEIKQLCDSLGKDVEFSYVMDHFEEERDQGITIDTTQTFFKTLKREYAIIDAPGHVEFVKNMITGASQADAAILILDAEEGVKEQTRRHAYILSMLGLNQIILAINKMDLVGYDIKRFEELKTQAIDFLNKLGIQPKYVIPIVAKDGDNIAKKSKKMDWFKGMTVLQALDKFETSKGLDKKPLRFPVQDVYNFDKRIIAGRIASGSMRKGDEIILLPSKETTHIKSIEEYAKNTTQAFAGKSIGIVTEDKVFADRGNVIVKKGETQPVVTNSINCHIFWMDPAPFKKGERLLFKCATQEIMCDMEVKQVIDSSTLNIIRDNAGSIENCQVADVIIKTEKPLVVENFNNVPVLGRFVLQRQDTCAGGIITG